MRLHLSEEFKDWLESNSFRNEVISKEIKDWLNSRPDLINKRSLNELVLKEPLFITTIDKVYDNNTGLPQYYVWKFKIGQTLSLPLQDNLYVDFVGPTTSKEILEDDPTAIHTNMINIETNSKWLHISVSFLLGEDIRDKLTGNIQHDHFGVFTKVEEMDQYILEATGGKTYSLNDENKEKVKNINKEIKYLELKRALYEN